MQFSRKVNEMIHLSDRECELLEAVRRASECTETSAAVRGGVDRAAYRVLCQLRNKCVSVVNELAALSDEEYEAAQEAYYASVELDEALVVSNYTVSAGVAPESAASESDSPDAEEFDSASPLSDPA